MESGGAAPPARITTTLLGGDENTPVIFTPRGTVANRAPLDLVIRHTGASQASRCVRINAITGLIELGHNNRGTADPCPEASFTEAI